MVQLNAMPGLDKVAVDFTDESLPLEVRKLQPVVFNSPERGYFCVLGPDPRAGVFGCGHTLADTFQDFTNRLADRAQLAPEVIAFIEANLDREGA